MKIPTDLQILNAIYAASFDNYAAYSDANQNRSSKSYVPIDIAAIAKNLNTEVDLVFGRLYYHLEKKYGYKNDDNSFTHFFAPRVGADRHCVNFPYMASVLATLRTEDRKYRLATVMAAVSLFLSVLSFILTRLK